MNGHSIPLSRVAICPDDLVVFEVTDLTCPKCGSDSWSLLEAPRVGELLGSLRTLIFKQRDLLDEARGVCLTIGKRLHGPSSSLAHRMAERIAQHQHDHQHDDKTKTPAMVQTAGARVS